MTPGSLALVTAGDQSAWNELVRDRVDEVWAITSELVDYGRALDAGTVVFRRLADAATSLTDSHLDGWLGDQSRNAVLQARAAVWRPPVPSFEPFEGVPAELVDRARSAFQLRIPESIAVPVYDSAAPDTEYEARGMTVTWRGRDSGSQPPLLVPGAVWEGIFEIETARIELALFQQGGRRLVGSVSGLEMESARLRGDPGAWSPLDANQQFRIERLPLEPISIELASAERLMVTEWRTL